MSLGLPGAVTTTNVLDAKLVGLPDNRPALTTVSICAVSAGRKTSTVAPWVSCVASSEDPAKSKSTLLPGWSDVNRSLIFVNAGLSDAAANTTSFPELGEDVGDADEDGFGLHPTRAASRIVATKPARTRNRRMDETLARRRSRSMAWAEESGGGAEPGDAAEAWLGRRSRAVGLGPATQPKHGLGGGGGRGGWGRRRRPVGGQKFTEL